MTCREVKVQLTMVDLSAKAKVNASMVVNAHYKQLSMTRRVRVTTLGSIDSHEIYYACVQSK